MEQELSRIKSELEYLFNLPYIKPRDYLRRESLLNSMQKTCVELQNLVENIGRDYRNFKKKQNIDSKIHKKLLEKFGISTDNKVDFNDNNKFKWVSLNVNIGDISNNNIGNNNNNNNTDDSKIEDKISNEISNKISNEIFNQQKSQNLNAPFFIIEKDIDIASTYENLLKKQQLFPLSNGKKLLAFPLKTWEDLTIFHKKYPFNLLFYIESAGHFASYSPGRPSTIFHGNIGRVFDYSDARPFKFKDCKFGISCTKNMCQYYHDPQLCGGTDIRNYLNNIGRIIITYKMFLENDNKIDFPHEEKQYFQDYMFHLYLCFLSSAAE